MDAAFVIIDEDFAGLVHASGLVAVQVSDGGTLAVAVVVGSLAQTAGTQHVDVGGVIDLVRELHNLGIAGGGVDAAGPGEVPGLDNLTVHG